MIDKLGGRKFVGFVLMTAAGIAVHIFTKAGLTSEATIFLVSMYGAFSTANVAATISALRGGSGTTADLTPISARLEAIEASLSNPAIGDALAGTLSQLAAIQHGVQLQNEALAKLMAGARPQPKNAPGA